MYRSPLQVRLLNVLKGLVLAGCLFTAVWLIATAPPDLTAVAQTAPDPTPIATAEPATPTPTSEPEPDPEPTVEPALALPTMAATAVPLPTTATIIIIPPVTATLPAPTAVPTVTVTTERTTTAQPLLPTAVLTFTAPSISGEAQIPPSIIPPALPLDENAPPLLYYPADGQTRQATDIDLLGIAQPNSTLELLINDQPFALIPITSLDGRWFYTFPTRPGAYSFTVRYLSDPDRASETILVTLVTPPDEDNCADPTPGQDLGDSYIVGDCEWLLGIARKLDIIYFDLLSMNPELQNPNFLISGQRLRLPPRGE